MPYISIFGEAEMKRIVVLVAVVLSIVSGSAQKIGGFGHISIGATGLIGKQIQNRLQEQSLFGSGFSFNQPGTHIGARVLGVFDRVIIGGSGYSNTFSGNSTERDVTLKIIGRFVNMGYMLIYKPKIQVYGFVGVGSGSSSLRLLQINDGSVGRKMSFGANQDVIGLDPEVSQSGIGYEFGVGVQRFIAVSNSYDEVKSGFLVGLVAGANLFPSTNWEFNLNGSNVANMGRTSSFYIGITIGGGGFSN